MMASSDVYTDDTENDIGEPLDSLQMHVNSKNGIQIMASALHIGFMETRSYIQFTAPPILINDTGQDVLTADEEEWLESASFLEEDLHWILRLPHHRFWSQIVYDENLHRCLESYLSQAPRDYDLVHLRMKDEVYCLLKQIHKLVFLVYLRMSTYKESKKHHIRPEAFGSYIYDNFLFDVPKLMDICALYGFQNQQIVQKMILNIFSTQPKYTEDLNQTSVVILEVFNTIEEKLSTHSHERQGSSDKEAVNRLSVKKEISVLPFHDVVSYITDVSATLHAFLEIYPPACQAFYQNDGAIRIATFYEQAFSMIEKEISLRKKQSGFESVLEDIKRKMTLSKTLLLKIFRNILSYCCMQHVINSSSSNNPKKVCENPHAEHFLEMLTVLASEKNFLHDYNLLYPFESDVELFCQLGLKLEPERLSYIFCSIHETGDELPEQFISSVSNGARPKTKKQTGTVQSLQSAAAILKENPSQENGQSLNFTNDSSGAVEDNGLNEYEISSLIQSVLDVLPELGDGFIEKCLQHFDFDAERVIDAILSNDTLPGYLNNLDRNLKRELMSEARTNSSYSILSERKNVYDHDEFDLFNRDDVDLSNIHIGKKNKTPISYETLQNTEESEFLKQLTLKFGDDKDSDNELNLYEDDYDDTYDSAMVGVKEPAPEGQPDDAPDDGGNDEGETDSSGPSRDSSKDFCINPEVTRDRAEQRRQSKIAARRGGRDGPPSSDDAHGRQQKDRHKGRVGNHNRRSQADYKRSRGMGALPSR